MTREMQKKKKDKITGKKSDNDKTDMGRKPPMKQNLICQDSVDSKDAILLSNALELAVKD